MANISTRRPEVVKTMKVEEVLNIFNYITCINIVGPKVKSLIQI